MEFDIISNRVIGCAIEVHRHLGPGLLESIYQQCLARELSLQNIAFEMEVALPVTYKGVQLDCGYRIDFIIEKQLIIELKSVAELTEVHYAQILTYLKLMKSSVGLLINFNAETIKAGLKRLVL